MLRYSMAKNIKKTREDLAFPVALIPKMSLQAKPPENPDVIKKIIMGAIRGAYQLKTPSEPYSHSPEYKKKQKPLVTPEQVEFVTHMIESMQPSDAIETALASQFVISYVRGIEATYSGNHSTDSVLRWFEFGHQVLESFIKYRTKGAQLISVNYNHNQGQINNIKIVENTNPSSTIEVN